MKKLIFLIVFIALITSNAVAQCGLPYCGSLPLMQFSNEDGGFTSLYLSYDTDCGLYFRAGFSSVEGGPPDYFYHQVGPGPDRFILSDAMAIFPGYTARGTFTLDWASECEPRISSAGLYNSSAQGEFFYNIDKPELFEPGHHTFYANANKNFRFHIYNYHDSGVQVVNIGGDNLILVRPGETVEYISTWDSYFVDVEVGANPIVGFPGLDLTLNLYIEAVLVGGGGSHRMIHLE